MNSSTSHVSLTTVTDVPSTPGVQLTNTVQSGVSTASDISSPASHSTRATKPSPLKSTHALLSTIIHPPSNNAASIFKPTASVTQATNTVCLKPQEIPNGQITSKGPYTAGKTEAIYTCVTGFSLVGTGTIKCGLNGRWPNELPQCLVTTTSGQGGNNIYVGDSLPLWLALVLALTFCAICLVLLVCLVSFCLRMCGCWKGSLFGEPHTTSTIAPSSTGGSHAGQDVPMANKGTSVSYIELEPFDDYQMHTTVGQPPDDSRYFFTENTRGGKVKRGNRFIEGQYNNNNNHIDSVRKGGPKKAKRPSKPTWMPHAQQRRNINTSTN